jgi:hypothetical protein
LTEGDGTRQVSPRQERAIELLLAGSTITRAAHEVGVSRQTVSLWVNHDPFFSAELNVRRQDLWRSGQDRLRSLLPDALAAVAGGLVGDQGWRVGLKLLEMAGFAGNYGQIGHAEAEVFLNEAARARRDDPWEVLIAECGNPPVSKEERRRVVEELARNGALDTVPDNEGKAKASGL